ncbi:hypothetical protein QCA50_003448 [Cerrena zonata]|uniref:Large ribosomal subunit protein mL54 n=1 Tax=Cerrena zonata TaxID=2478898 RepID=A0AAW0GS52_9APHY
MSLLYSLRRPQRHLLTVCRNAPRCYATKTKPVEVTVTTPEATTPEVDKAGSSAPEGTVLTGLNYLKGQPQVVALADDAYPPWLWKLLEPKVIPDDGPGGVGEKLRMRRERRQRIRDQNFMKTQ